MNLSMVPWRDMMMSVIGVRKRFISRVRALRVGLEAFRDGGEAADVAEQHRHGAGFAAQLEAAGIGGKRAHHLRRQVMAEGRFDEAAFAVDDPVAEQQTRRHRRRQRHQRIDQRQPQSARKGKLAERRPGQQRHHPGQRRKSCRQPGGGEAARPGQKQHHAHHDNRPGRRILQDEMAPQNSVDHGRQPLGAGKLGVAEGRSIGVAIADKGCADHYDAACEPRGRYASAQQVDKGVCRHRAPRSGIIDQQAHSLVGRYAQIADGDPLPQPKTHIAPFDAAIFGGGAYGQGRKEIAAERSAR